MAKIAFIGLGNMGLPMATNLAKAGHELCVFDRENDPVNKAKSAGMQPFDSANAAVEGAEFVITMLPNGPIVLDVFQEILSACDPNAVLIDCSTIDFESAKTAHKLAKDRQLGCLDAPVSGGVGGAEAGTLTFMIGGDASSFEAAKPLLECMGQRLVHCGQGGAGQAAKICNNMLLGISMIGACEAFALAEKLDLDQQALFDVISTSSGYCWSVNTYCPVPGIGPKSPADNDYKPGFAAALMLKDLKLSQQAAQDVMAATPMGARATEFYEAYVDDGHGEVDFSGVIKTIQAKQR